MSVRSRWKIDPDDGEAYTFQQLASYYQGTYPKDVIQEYWDFTCVPTVKRTDPHDGVAYTYDELFHRYGWEYDAGTIRRYWEVSCLPEASRAARKGTGQSRRADTAEGKAKVEIKGSIQGKGNYKGETKGKGTGAGAGAGNATSKANAKDKARTQKTAGPISITVSKLSGGTAWGPESIDSSEQLHVLQERVAEALGIEPFQLILLLGSKYLNASKTLAEQGISDGSSLTMILHEFDAGTIEAIQKEMGSMLPGLTSQEVQIAEGKFGFQFPPDLKAFLQVGVPSSWHNWHTLIKDDVDVGGQNDTVSQQIDWNAKPEEIAMVPTSAWAGPDETFDDLLERWRQHPLIPISGHRMIPSVPHLCGLPVFSMHQCSDNIVYGENFWVWLEEDKFVKPGIIPTDWKKDSVPLDAIPFWKDWVD